LLLVDAISALGAIALPMDALGIDVLVTASQKAWMAPPGTTMLGVSPTAWRRHATARMPRFYWDFTTQRKAQSKGQDAWTPAMGTMFALQAALRLMRSEGREAIIARHRHLAAQAQQGLLDLGLRLFAEQGHRSLTVTAACVPDNVDGAALIRQAHEYGLVVGGGQETLAGKIIRLGHMGWVEDEHITSAVAALERSLATLGSSAPAGSTIVAGG
jgi:aspartate aminotransferase-like enzyme